MEIEWREISGYEGLYEINNFGDVKTTSGKKRKSYKTRKYFGVLLSKNGVKRHHPIHRLVAASFIGKCPENKEVNHIDCDRDNNYVGNLEYVTHQENVQHALDNGMYLDRIGEKNHASKLGKEDIEEIRMLYYIYGFSYKELSKIFCVNRQHIGAIINWKFWKHVEMVV